MIRKIVAIMIGLIGLTLLLTACPGIPIPGYVLEVSGGTYTQQQQIDSKDVVVGTSVIVKLRTGSGDLVSSKGTVTIHGPQGWNADAAATFSYPTRAYWAVSSVLKAVPVAGDYQVDVVLGNEKVTGKFSIADPTLQLPLADITLNLQGDAPNQIVQINWNTVPSALGYYTRVMDGTTGTTASGVIYTLTNKAEVLVGTLNPAHQYYAVVYAASVDTETNEPTLPTQFNVSDSFAAINQLGISSSHQGHTRARIQTLERDGFQARQ